MLKLLDRAPAAVVSAFEKQLVSLKNPPVTREQLLDTLSSNGLPQAVAKLRELFSR